MAINALVYGGAQTKIGLSQETTFGTAIADGGAFVQFVDAEIPADVDFGLTRDESMKNRGARVKYFDDNYVTQSGGTRNIPVSNIIPRRTDLAELIYGVMQNVTEAAATPFTKTFILNSTTTQPNFAGNAGYFCSLGIYSPIASFHQKFISAIIKSLELSFDLTGGDGRLKANAEFISGFSASTTANFSGTWAPVAKSFFDFTNPLTFQIASSDVVCYGFSLSINNNAVRVGNTSAGDCQTYAVGVPNYEVTGSIKVKYDANVQGLLAAMIAGTKTKIQVATGTVGAAGHLDFTLNACELNKHSWEMGQEYGTAVEIGFEAKYDLAGSANLLTITLSDALDQVW
jgi:hypothetical protein